MSQFQSYTQYLIYMDNNYNEEEQLIIEDFISYYINKYKKFGYHNCERTYQENLKLDQDGKLHKFALIGFEFEKKLYDNRKLKK